MLSPYQKFQNELNELLDSGLSLEEVVSIVSQQYCDLEEKAAQALRDKEKLEKDLRDCQRKLRDKNK